ncbi:MAG: transporter substrate-binding domain-containing protein [Methanospirillum sp.]|uniref:substrate-binding periplasmic protein n=1 Tax=Methanospirillum sp. TaxID=45200 RepID=UPI00236BBB35|nr:transporter substrate-binding domain-containing protein [Methanospirillum sp.]MDD1728567.1 transporter substrate-binding domain-containing protein [Methanospirillum sp.]
MKSIYCLLIGIVLVMLLFTTITTAASPDRLDTIIERGSLIIAMEPVGAPYGSIVPGVERSSVTNCSGDCYTENQMTGFDIAVTSAIARKLGVEACYRTPAHDLVETRNWSGWDLFTNYYITNDRLDDYYFTRPIVSESSRFYIRTNETEITGLSNLSGKIIGVGNASAQLNYLKNKLDIIGTVYENPVVDPVIKEYTDEYDALDALNDESVDAILISETTGEDAIANGTRIVGLNPAAFTGYGAYSLSKQSEGDAKQLVEKIDGILADMYTDGELSNLYQVYLGGEFTKDAESFNISTLNQFSG